MYNWAEICSELKDLEKNSEKKIESIRAANRYPMPYDRLKKGKEIIALSKALRLFIEQDQEKDATVLLQMLQEMGVKLKSVR